jgi:hypothetical protein
MSIDNDPLYLPDEAANQLRSNPRTLERWRTTGDGPAFTKIGRRVVYRRSALEAFIERRTQQHTTERER